MSLPCPGTEAREAPRILARLRSQKRIPYPVSAKSALRSRVRFSWSTLNAILSSNFYILSLFLYHNTEYDPYCCLIFEHLLTKQTPDSPLFIPIQTNAPEAVLSSTNNKSHGQSASSQPEPSQKTVKDTKILSCHYCRRQKLKCDRSDSCGVCQARCEGHLCTWEEGQRPE